MEGIDAAVAALRRARRHLEPVADLTTLRDRLIGKAYPAGYAEVTAGVTSAASAPIREAAMLAVEEILAALHAAPGHADALTGLARQAALLRNQVTGDRDLLTAAAHAAHAAGTAGGERLMDHARTEALALDTAPLIGALDTMIEELESGD